jgi:hypothetical protein
LLKEYGVSIKFDRGAFSYFRAAELKQHSFITKLGLKKEISDNQRVIERFFLSNNPVVKDIRTSQFTVEATPQLEQFTALPFPTYTRPLQEVSLETET